MKWMIFYSLMCLSYWMEAMPYCIGQFELLNKMIVVEATIEERDGYFIIDTGAPDLVLNQQHFDGEASDWLANSINCTTAVKSQWVGKFEWGCVKQKNFTALVVDLSYLEQAIGKPFLGLIGYEILKQKELLFDYENRRIEQHRLRKSDLHDLDRPVQAIPFRMAVHAPLLELEMNQERMDFILDTASEDNLLAKTKNSSRYRVKALKFLVGADQRTSLARVVVVPSANLTNIAFDNQEYLLTSLNHTKAKGILGFPVLNALNKFSINYRKRKIYLWD
ncbi:MAG: hypothetical protein AAF847_16705 [Bacteroidota bacterium]